MLERLGQTFAKREPLPTADTYLASLDPDTRINVKQFLEFARDLSNNLGKARVAILAVGSSTQPEKNRHHPVQDIDLRILNSAPANTQERETAIDTLRSRAKAYLNKSGFQFEEKGFTMKQLFIRGSAYDPRTEKGTEELISFADYYNNDPSFIAKPKKGLPLHISISGVNNYPLEEYLKKERSVRSTAILLYQSKSPIVRR